jgi:predicted permease
MSAPLPPFAAWFVRLVVPPQRRETVLQDLADDYASARHGGAARWWLVRETGSLGRAYAGARVRALKASGPMWARDFTLVVRGFRRGPFAALAAAAMLSTGLAAVMLSVGLTRALLFREVSATHGEALRRIAAVDRQGRSALRLSYVELQLIRDHLDGVGVLGSVNMQPVVVRVERDAIQTMAEVVDAHYFALTGTETVIGRGLMTIDDRPDAPPTAVISEPFWRRRFGASPSVLGGVVHLNGQPFTIVGVARALGSSSFLGASVDAWVATAQADPLLNRGWRTDVDARWFTAFLLPGATPAEIDARLEAASALLGRSYPTPWAERRLRTAAATVLVGSQRTSVTVLAGILAGLSLLILATAASNLGGLLLARAATTRRHVAIHLSIGSGRAAIIRRQLMEGALLGTAAAGMAIALCAWISNRLHEVAVLPTLALRLALPLDARVMTLMLAAGAVVGFLLALGPALWATRVDLADAMRDAETRSSGSRGLSRIRRLLVTAQVSLTLVLIVAAALFVKSLDALLEADLGFAREDLVAMDFDLEPAGPAMGELASLAREALRQVEAMPGVVAAAMSNRAPIDSSTPTIDLRARQEGAPVGDVSMYLATARYFDTVGIPVLAGRAFTEQECHAGAAVAIVNETLARQLWSEGDALDRPLYISGEPRPVRVIGVARNSKYRSIGESLRPHVYRPTPPALGRTLLVRTSRDPRAMLGPLQQTLDAVGPGLVGFFPRTMDDHLAIQLLPTRAAATAATALGTLALVLSAFGLYGLVSWFVELRRREIGVRMALGASTRDVRRLIVRQALATALPGVAAGVLLAGTLAVVARSALFGVGALDPAAIALAIFLLLLVVSAAAYGPSRRATRVDPAVTLRS